MIYRLGITRDHLVNAIDICRAFEASFDFWDGDGDGWDVLTYSHHWFRSASYSDAEAVAAFSSSLVKSSSPDIKDALLKENLSEENLLEKHFWFVIDWADDQVADFVELLLGLIPAGSLHDNANLLQSSSRLLSTHIVRQNSKIVNLLLAWGADPHHVYARTWQSPVPESPLSFAMYSSWAFWAFRNVLQSKDLDVQDFASKELEEGSPLLKAGWQMETLTALLELDFNPDIAPHNCSPRIRCDSCNGKLWLDIEYPDITVQPYWQSFLESVKNGVSPLDLCSVTQDEQPSNDQHNLTVFNDLTTDTADDSESSQDPALSEDEAADSDEESPINGVDISSTTFDRKEIWCINCWFHFKETGRRRCPTSRTEPPNEDDDSEDDFSPYLIHT